MFDKQSGHVSNFLYFHCFSVILNIVFCQEEDLKAFKRDLQKAEKELKKLQKEKVR